ncbi:hypothetical protein BJ508DRAFT_314248 [Ascobolus immersus RN42]|uniref:Uncharacterized protein n=1 Tax=Ascobolus immersus RN42 TaxID=1160509 RepID=A0A3N4HFT5_ASCIM|nr:hypothetical protein BJ508DRAFT_314248 [Ascobolus immersus RN42]
MSSRIYPAAHGKEASGTSKIQKARLRLDVSLNAIFAAFEKNDAETEYNDPHREVNLSEVGLVDSYTGAPLAKREFVKWLSSCSVMEIKKLVHERRSALLLPEGEIIKHAKSLCDIGDRQETPLWRGVLPKLGTYGTARRQAPKRLQRRDRYTNIDRKSDEMGYRHLRLQEAPELESLQLKLDSTDLHNLLLQKGSAQPEPEEASILLEAGITYTQVSADLAAGGLCAEDREYNTLFDLLPVDEINPKYILRLEHTFNELCSRLPNRFFDRDDKRFSKACDDSHMNGIIHLGVWNQATWQHERPACSFGLRGGSLKYKEDENYMLIQQFLVENDALFRHIGGILKRMDEKLYEEYSSIELPPFVDKTLFWPFCMLAINRNCFSLPHKDLNDLARGFCFLLCWGDFKGGDVTFAELRLKIPLQKGQLLVFRSALLTHWNQPVYEGVRHSMVLFTPSRMFNWKQITTVQVLNRWNREIKDCTEYLATLGYFS